MGVFSFLGWGKSAITDRYGIQSGIPSASFIEDTPATNFDASMQISTVWRAVEISSKLIATLPMMVYESRKGVRDLARESSLWQVLHESPNSRMTPSELWMALMINLLMRGNAYARIERSESGEAYALWPMQADQVMHKLLKDGTEVYEYRIGESLAILSADNVLHIKEMGNGTTGLARLDHMRATTSEVQNSQRAANKLFANGGKPTGFLMIDGTINKQQRADLQRSFIEMVSGSTARLSILEANMKFNQVNLTPEDMQLLSTRSFSVQEIGRWFGIPAILLNQTEGTTTLGSSSADIIDNFYKLTVRPIIISIEQAIRKRVMTARQRANMDVEFNMDGLLRASLSARMDIYSKAVQNGVYSRNDCRQLENMPPFDGGDIFTAQSNLLPINMIGKTTPTGGAGGNQANIAQ
jgi:HK97 family phage portal protein